MSLQRLEQKFGITGEDLVTVMINSVAVRPEEDIVFWL